MTLFKMISFERNLVTIIGLLSLLDKFPSNKQNYIWANNASLTKTTFARAWYIKIKWEITGVLKEEAGESKSPDNNM